MPEAVDHPQIGKYPAPNDQLFDCGRSTPRIGSAGVWARATPTLGSTASAAANGIEYPPLESAIRSARVWIAPLTRIVIAEIKLGFI